MKTQKVEKIAKETQKKKTRNLRPDDIQYIIELANEHPRWSVEKIFEVALSPRLRTSLLLPLTPKMEKALKKAANIYQISVADICYHIFEEWLKERKMFKD